MTLAFILFSGLMLLAACDIPTPVRYPISGIPCGPDDPVHDLRPHRLAPI